MIIEIIGQAKLRVEEVEIMFLADIPEIVMGSFDLIIDHTVLQITINIQLFKQLIVCFGIKVKICL